MNKNLNPAIKIITGAMTIFMIVFMFCLGLVAENIPNNYEPYGAMINKD